MTGEELEDFHQTDCISRTVMAAMAGGATGIFLGSIVAAWKLDPQVKDQTGPMLRITYQTIKSNTVLLAGIAAVFAGTECAVANIRQKKDPWNGVAAGCAAGSILGLRGRSIGGGIFACAALAGLSVVMDLSGYDFKYVSKWNREQNKQKDDHHE